MAIIRQTRGLGIVLPIERGPTGYFRQGYTIRDQMKSNLINLIMTRKGERVMLPTFGCGIYEYIFEPLTQTTLSSIRGTIEEAIAIWMPHLSVQSLEVVETKEHTVTVTLSYIIQNNANMFDSVQFQFSTGN